MRKVLFLILILASALSSKANCGSGLVSVPIVDSITVDTAGNVTICWQALADPDMDYYIIFMYNPVTGANDSINVVNAGNNCFTLPAGQNNSDFETVELSIVGVDICDNASTSGVNYHNTILLEYTVDICSATINLSWSPYDDFNSGINVDYRIYVSKDGAPYAFIGNTTSTNFSYPGIVQGSTYNFFVRAFENGGAGPFSSSSNDVYINTINFLKDPQFNYLYTATVVDSQEILVQFYVDTAADVSHYNIKRKETSGDAYTLISSVPAYAGMNPMVTYYDIDVDANTTHYYYQIETINTCQQLKYTSNIGKTIWLNVESEGAGVMNTISFSQYRNWDGGVQKYEIYRAIGGVWESTPITQVAAFSDTTVYVDNIINIADGDGSFCYKVVAVENTFPHVGGLPEATSTSNESCVTHSPLVYVPNAFTPFSPYNYEFKPVLTFTDPNSYLLQIYNKWGQKIFETQDLNTGWLGSVDNTGKLCQSDSYVYMIRFTSADGEEFSKSGVVTLLK